MKKFLIINPFGIGDVLFTTALIRAIKESQPDSVIGYWCNERVKDILINNPRVDRVFALSRGDLKKIYQRSKLEGIRRFLGLLRQIRKERFDATVDFSLDHRYGLISKLLGIKKRAGFNYKNRGRFLTDKIDIDSYKNKHVVEYYLDLLQFFDIRPKTNNLEIFVPEYNRIKAKNIFIRAGIKDEDRIIGIAAGAGASWGQDASYKHWPAIKYARLADKIIDNFAAKIIILGDISERPIADIITAAMKNKTIDLTGKISLMELCAIIKGLQLLITNDGGPLHIAAAAGVKTVSIFGPVDDLVYGPYPASGKHIVIKRALSCRPCYQNFRMPICENNKECINSIDVDEVFEAVSLQLSSE